MATTASPEPATVADELVVDVVEAVARSTDSDPLSLPPLNRSIDPEALDAIAEGAGLVELTFTYHGHLVTIDADGAVQVSPTAQ
ncbi:HalOD1 output domain-containing protein [Halobacteriales archaeon Cl-PHB]